MTARRTPRLPVPRLSAPRLPASRLLALAALLSAACAPALAQPIEAGSQDALELPYARQPDDRQDRGTPASARRGQYRDRATLGAASPDLAPDLPPPRGYGVPAPYGYGAYGSGYGGPAYGTDDPGYGAPRPGYPGSYGNQGSYAGRNGIDGPYGEPAFVAPFGGGPGNQTPIPLGAGSLYGGSAVNGTAVGPQFSSQLPAYQGRARR